MVGKNIRRTLQVSLVFLILSIIQIMPFGERTIDSFSVDSTWTETTQTDFTTGISDVSKKLAEDVPLDFDMPKMDSSYFTENLGQWEDHIRFLAQTSFGYAALSDDGVLYYVIQEEEGHVIKLTFQNAELIYPVGRGDVGFYSNYFYGNDSTKWVKEARSYEIVLYKDVWPGIDILYYFKTGNLKYDIIISEHTTPQAISFFIEGHKELDINEDGLEIFISKGVSISDTDLVAFYEDGSTVPIQFKKTSDHSYGFDVKKIDGRILTIDPIIFSTSTFLGGSGWEDARDMAIDAGNNIIILGETSSNDFPNTTGAYQTGGGDIVVTKMDQNATGLIFSTYIGGWIGDNPKGLEVDDNGDIYVSGLTWSQSFPTTPGVFQEKDPSGSYPDVFVLKLNSQGSNLIYSTYIGGTQSDYAYDIKVRNGKAYVVGSTLSYDFPTVGPPVGNPHGSVLFFILNQDGSNLTNSAFWGGWSNEFGYSLAIDKIGDVVLGGVTFSLDFPTTPGAYQTTVNDMNNGFVIKYRPSSNSTIFCTYIGGDVGENVKTLCVDDNTDIYFAGWTSNPSGGGKPYPTTVGAFDRTINGSKDLFITKMDPNGTMLIYSTFIGGDGDEESGRIDVDAEGNVYFTGLIDSELNFTVTPGCFDDTYNGEDDAFVVILNRDGSNLIYGSFLGGNSSDSGSGCILTKTNDFIIFGSTFSEDFPVTKGSYQTKNKGSGDIFLTKFSIGDLMLLHEGWNLISIPLIQPDTNLGTVLSSIDGYFDAAQLYNASDVKDPWKHHHISKPAHLNDFKNIDHTIGFWIYVTKPNGTLFRYHGVKPTVNQNISLHKGWNMIGYPSPTNHVIKSGLNNLKIGIDIDSIWTYNAATQKWEEMGPNDFFVPGRGYWFHSKFDTTWIVPL